MSDYFCVIEPIAIAGSVLASTNVPETEYTEYAAGTSYALDAFVRVTSEHNVYKSLVAANVGNTPSTSPTKWQLMGKTNAYAMFDGKVNTQTTNANSIVVNVTPSQIAGGVCLMNVEADSVTLTSTDPVDGVVFSDTKTSEKSNSLSSFYNWGFRRIRRRTVFAWTDLPPCYGATLTITISKPGGTAKCGMLIVGPVEQLGFTKFGLSPSIKDYSSNLFDTYGNLTTTERAWGKLLSVNVEVDNGFIDDLQLLLAGWRAKGLVWIASKDYESTILYARFASFKVVIDNVLVSDCALQLDGLI